MTEAIRIGFGLGVLALLLLDALLVRSGSAANLVPHVAGTAPWLVSRALGITAFASLTAEVVFGLLSSTGAADGRMGRARAIDVHGWLSGVTWSLVAAHALTLLLDEYVGFDLLDLVVPFLGEGRRAGVSIGIVATYVGLAVHVSSRFRKDIGARTWRRLHYASFAVFFAVVAHVVTAGTDARSMPMRSLTLVAAGTVSVLTLRRVAMLARGRTRAAAVRPDAGRAR